MTADRNRRVFVVLGVFRPDLALLSRQIGSLLAQTHSNIVVLVSSDGPLADDAAAIISKPGDPRIVLKRCEPRVGVHANFARGLREALSLSDDDSDLFAFCDQDDVWRADKLQRQVACLADGGVSLCHSDARIVSRDGKVLAPSLFDYESRLRRASLFDLLVMNSVTGMTAMFRRDVALAASPFPLARCRYLLHDHWTALVAALMGRIALIEEPLVDYVQHGESVLGARAWAGSLGGTRLLADAAYLRKCYRQYSWRRRALLELERGFGDRPGARERLSAGPVKMLFDCGTSRYAGLALSLAARARGERRQADQLWRLGRGKALDCARRGRG